MAQINNLIDINLNVTEYDLYQNGQVVNFPDGESVLERKQIKYSGNENDKFHHVLKGEILTMIAWKEYSDIVDIPQFYWWIIAEANEILNPLDITEYEGTQIIIPDLNEFLRQYNQA